MTAEPPSAFLERMRAFEAGVAAKVAVGGAFAHSVMPAAATQSVGAVIGSMIRIRPCVDCGNEFEGIIGLCPDCSELRLALEKQKEALARDKAKLALWRGMCPLAYRETNWAERSLARGCVVVAQSWRPAVRIEGVADLNAARPPGISLGLFGTTGSGKTRAAFHILHRHYQAGWSVFAIHSADAWDNGEHVQGLSSAVRLQYSDDRRIADAARECLLKARNVNMLLIDDIGKERTSADGTVSEAVGEALYGLIEYRVANARPTIWTCNMSAGGLEKRLGEDRGAPVLRRLRDVSAIPKL